MTTTVYTIRDVYGEVIAEHVAVRLPEGRKRMWWRIPGMSPEDGLCGLSTAELPLYGSEEVGRWPVGATVIVTEGEKARDALAVMYPYVLGTVTGAGGTPGEDALAILLPFDLVLWPDHDEAGVKHMARVAAGLVRLGGGARRLVWGTEKGDDAADFVARGGARTTLDLLLADAEPWRVAPAESTPSRPAYERQDDSRVQSARAHLLEVVTARIGPPKRWRQGTPWWSCPFHGGDRDPSFKVDMREPYYRCFGCDARGDVFTFLRAIEGAEFKDALRELAPPPALGGIPRLWA